MELRKLPQLRERKRGYFSRGTRAFLHFHQDAGNLYVDVRLDSAFQRVGSPAPMNRPISSHGAKGTPVERFGPAAYDIMLGDCLWHIYALP